MRADELRDLLRKRYAPPEYALVTEVRNAAGFSASRSADALALGLWPSRGLFLHGFEIKVQRSDWLREKKDPAKAEAIAKYCDYWWVVAPDTMVVPVLELPEQWGLLTVQGKALEVAAPARLLDAKPLDRGFIAAFARRLTEQIAPEAELQKAELKGFKEGKRQGKKDAGVDLERLEAVKDFERRTGLTIFDERWSRELADAFQRYMYARREDELTKLQRIGDQARRLADEVDEKLRELTTEPALAGGSD